MIFNREQPNIKTLAVETLQNIEDRSDKPFDYRKDISAQEKQKLLELLASDLHANIWDNYVGGAAALKYLQIPILPLSADKKEALVGYIESRVRRDAAGTINPAFYRNIALYDRHLIDDLPHEVREQFNGYVRRLPMPTRTELQVYYAAGKRILDPQSWHLPKDFHKRPVPPIEDHFSIDDLAELAHVKLCDSSLVREIEPHEWRRMREKMRKHINYEIYTPPQPAIVYFYARILAAKDITIDENGLHFIDRDSEPSIKSSVDRPMPKHL